MYLFSRSAVLADNDGLAWATAMTEHAKRATGLEIELWGQVWSPEFGRIAWTAMVPDLATLATAGDAMAADAAMTKEGAKGAALTNGGLDDALYTIVHGEIAPAAPAAEYVTAVSSVCANGQTGKAMAAGVEIAQRAEKITGTTTMFVANVTGIYGGVGWITGHANIAELEASQQAMAHDVEWSKEVDKLATTFASDPSATNSVILRRFV
ncbi:MAG: hypothetical protein JJE46_16485 [Acidimicrobiia bacterium]|nr:hypothetical protein [Acidimicrobiia bacterium]